MGTNYYCRLKASYEDAVKKLKDKSRLFDVCDLSNSVEELTNGYVWNKTYYKDLDELNNDYYITLHVGKSSYGWNFLLCLYPELNINSLDDWKEFFTNNFVLAYNEYDEVVNIPDLLDIITDRNTKYKAKELPSLLKHECCCNSNTGGTYDYTTEIDFS